MCSFGVGSFQQETDSWFGVILSDFNLTIQSAQQSEHVKEVAGQP